MTSGPWLMTLVAPAPLTAGVTAPDFTVPSTSGHPVTLSAFRGQKAVLLAFFPAAFTSVCTSEMCAFSEDYDQFSSLGVEVLPISVDNVPSLKEFRAKFDMKVHILSDLRRDVATAYGVLRTDSPIANRAYVLVDADGIIRWLHVEEHPGLRRENAEILDTLKNVMA